MTTKILVATAGVDLDISRNEETTKYPPFKIIIPSL